MAPPRVPTKNEPVSIECLGLNRVCRFHATLSMTSLLEVKRFKGLGFFHPRYKYSVSPCTEFMSKCLPDGSKKILLILNSTVFLLISTFTTSTGFLRSSMRRMLFEKAIIMMSEQTAIDSIGDGAPPGSSTAPSSNRASSSRTGGCNWGDVEG